MTYYVNIIILIMSQKGTMTEYSQNVTKGHNDRVFQPTYNIYNSIHGMIIPFKYLN